MIEPSAADILKAVEHTFEKVIKPDLSTGVARSAAATISHLLRHVALRIELEGQLLYDEAGLLRDLLPRIRDVIAEHDAGTVMASRVEEALSGSAREAGVYPRLDLMNREVGALRNIVCELLEFFQDLDNAALGGSIPQMHQELRDYVAFQIEQEARIIDPAMAGRGPRR